MTLSLNVYCTYLSAWYQDVGIPWRFHWMCLTTCLPLGADVIDLSSVSKSLLSSCFGLSITSHARTDSNYALSMSLGGGFSGIQPCVICGLTWRWLNKFDGCHLKAALPKSGANDFSLLESWGKIGKSKQYIILLAEGFWFRWWVGGSTVVGMFGDVNLFCLYSISSFWLTGGSSVRMRMRCCGEFNRLRIWFFVEQYPTMRFEGSI